jgi:hypothetical protein
LFVEVFIVIVVEERKDKLMKPELLYNVKKDIYINIQEDILKGDILDVGLDNYGIIYNLYKLQNKDITVDYIHGKEEKKYIEKECYDSCILLFSLRNIWLKYNKKGLFHDINHFLKEDGFLYIWDIDKSFSKFFNGKIKIVLPESNIKEININDLNIFKDASRESTIKLVEQYFEIIDLKTYDNVYYIKAKKRTKYAEHSNEFPAEVKGSTSNEDTISSNKFKIRSQQFGSKIFKGIHKRFKL